MSDLANDLARFAEDIGYHEDGPEIDMLNRAVAGLRQLAAARSALEPFAKAAENYADSGSDDRAIYIDHDATVSVANLRDARAAHSTLAQEPAGQSEAKPVAWQWRYVGDTDWQAPSIGQRFSDNVLRRVRPIEYRSLYAHPTVKVSGDAAEMRERAAQVAMVLARQEDERFRAAGKDAALSEGGRLAIQDRAITRENAFQGCATAIRSLPLTPEGRS